ncbi:MAG: DUF3488 domain-containing transglutaminase family protein [Gammaproteobacteria bacterium]|nr:DUF3488 domain-containing transglutaminase family protein [Gammaproteobacteria bacterium]
MAKSNLSPLQQTPQRHLLLLLIGYLAVGVSPHLFNLNPLFIGLFFVFAGFKALIAFYPRLQPRGLWLLLLTLTAFALVILRSAPLVSSETGISLLLVMAGLKLLEIRQRRDIQFSILLGFFLLITVFLYEDSMEMALLMLAVGLGLISLLVQINSLSPRGQLRPLRTALAFSLQALPLTLLLFFLFPRLGGPLWAFHSTEKAARSGLSDSVTPGSISNLILSKETAFRAEFTGPIPSPPQRYWRGPVMWRTDGLSWERSQQMMQAQQHPPKPTAQLDYRVFLEPTDKDWLILLDLPAEVNQKARITRDFQVIAETPVTKTLAYTATSYPSIAASELDPAERDLGLQLPSDVSPRVRALAEGWRENSSDAEIVAKALAHFRQNPFVYTLRPPLLGNDPTDEFLFETQRGFCEHYATSFTLLMRLAGIPSRLVTGYLGGELNPQGDYLIVRQADAHAWSEVWLQGQGWTRIDPTAAVAPERVEQQLDTDFAGDRAIFVLRPSAFTDRLMRNLHWGLDALNMSWYRWVIGYDRSKQRNLLSDIGLGWLHHRALGVLAFAIPLSLLGLYGLHLYLRERPRQDPAQQAYRQLLRRLEKRGISKPGWEGPRQFHQRLQQSHPNLAAQLQPLLAAYISIRYGQDGEKQQTDSFVKACREFRY